MQSPNRLPYEKHKNFLHDDSWQGWTQLLQDENYTRRVDSILLVVGYTSGGFLVERNSQDLVKESTGVGNKQPHNRTRGWAPSIESQFYGFGNSWPWPSTVDNKLSGCDWETWKVGGLRFELFFPFLWQCHRRVEFPWFGCNGCQSKPHPHTKNFQPSVGKEANQSRSRKSKNKPRTYLTDWRRGQQIPTCTDLPTT